MHTTRVKWKGGIATVAHNSDWSGMAIVSWNEGRVKYEVQVPAGFLVTLSLNAAKEWCRSKVAEALDL